MVSGTRFTSLVAFIVFAIAQPGLAAPVRDAQWAILANRLLPTLMANERAILGQDRRAAVPMMLAHRRERIDRCGHVVDCVLAAALWQDSERELLAGSVKGQSTDMRREIDGLNAAIQVYGLGKPPRYPSIEGPTDTIGSLPFTAKLADAVMAQAAGQDDPATALDPSIGLVLALLDANDADQAAAFEPLDATYNGPAMARARTLDWTRYRFTAIVVPGIGPDDPATPLSPKGKVNVRMAATRFADGVAPFIIVSGGTVHPRGTHFAEAIEMRRALIERFGIPADRIVVEPYARHTTTNLRNVTRRLVALGAPLDRMS